MTHDADIRPVLRAHLQRLHPSAMVVDELGLELGACRIDLAVIGDALHGFEIKAAADTMERLPAQSCVYNRTLDLVTIVVAANHLPAALASRWVPAWWGVWEVSPGGALRVEREAATNPEFTLACHTQLLWKGELAVLFERHTGKRAPSRWSKPEIRNALVERVAANVLRADVRWALRARGNWRARSRMTPAARAAREG